MLEPISCANPYPTASHLCTQALSEIMLRPSPRKSTPRASSPRENFLGCLQSRSLAGTHCHLQEQQHCQIYILSHLLTIAGMLANSSLQSQQMPDMPKEAEDCAWCRA